MWSGGGGGGEGENVLGYLSLDIICSSQLTIFLQLRVSENCSLLGTDNVRGQISQHILAPNGSYCLFISCITNMVSVRVIFWGAFLFLVHDIFFPVFGAF